MLMSVQGHLCIPFNGTSKEQMEHMLEKLPRLLTIEVDMEGESESSV